MALSIQLCSPKTDETIGNIRDTKYRSIEMAVGGNVI